METKSLKNHEVINPSLLAPALDQVLTRPTLGINNITRLLNVTNQPQANRLASSALSNFALSLKEKVASSGPESTLSEDEATVYNKLRVFCQFNQAEDKRNPFLPDTTFLASYIALRLGINPDQAIAPKQPEQYSSSLDVRDIIPLLYWAKGNSKISKIFSDLFNRVTIELDYDSGQESSGGKLAMQDKQDNKVYDVDLNSDFNHSVVNGLKRIWQILNHRELQDELQTLGDNDLSKMIIELFNNNKEEIIKALGLQIEPINAYDFDRSIIYEDYDISMKPIIKKPNRSVNQIDRVTKPSIKSLCNSDDQTAQDYILAIIGKVMAAFPTKDQLTNMDLLGAKGEIGAIKEALIKKAKKVGVKPIDYKSGSIEVFDLEQVVLILIIGEYQYGYGGFKKKQITQLANRVHQLWSSCKSES